MKTGFEGKPTSSTVAGEPVGEHDSLIRPPPKPDLVEKSPDNSARLLKPEVPKETAKPNVEQSKKASNKSAHSWFSNVWAAFASLFSGGDRQSKTKGLRSDYVSLMRKETFESPKERYDSSIRLLKDPRLWDSLGTSFFSGLTKGNKEKMRNNVERLVNNYEIISKSSEDNLQRVTSDALDLVDRLRNLNDENYESVASDLRNRLIDARKERIEIRPPQRKTEKEPTYVGWANGQNEKQLESNADRLKKDISNNKLFWDPIKAKSMIGSSSPDGFTDLEKNEIKSLALDRIDVLIARMKASSDIGEKRSVMIELMKLKRQLQNLNDNNYQQTKEELRAYKHADR